MRGRVSCISCGFRWVSEWRDLDEVERGMRKAGKQEEEIGDGMVS